MKILLIDLWNVFHVQWHAGTNKEARFPFTSTMGRIRAIAKDYDYCAVMTDGGKSFRKDLDSRWKANRDEKAAGLFAQLFEVERQLASEGFHVFKVDDLEADDLVASAVAQIRTLILPGGKLEGIDVHVTINSSDRDLYGLLEPGVEMLTTVEPHRIVRAEHLRQSKKIGVDPPKIRDFLVLADKHNGVKYFEGVGPVHAARLLNQFGNIRSIIAAVDNHVPDSDEFEVGPASIRAAIKKALAETVDGRPLLDVAMQIVTLRTDAQIDIKQIFEKREPKPAPQEDWNDCDIESGDGLDDQRGRAVGGQGAPASNGGSHGSSDRDPPAVASVSGAHTASAGIQSATGSGNRTEGVNDGQDAHAEHHGQGVRVRSLATGGEGEVPTMVVQPVGGDQGPRQNASDGSARTASSQQGAPSGQNALVIAPRWELALEPPSIQDAWRLAQRAAESGFWTKHGGPAGAMMIIMAGRSRGLTAFDALNGMHIIEGKPVFGAYLLIGMVQRDKRCAYFELVESDEKHAKWITKRKGSKIEQARTYTIEQATKAELNKPTYNGKASNWMKHPEDMLIKTAGAKLTRAAWADITSGAVAAEEMGYE